MNRSERRAAARSSQKTSPGSADAFRAAASREMQGGRRHLTDFVETAALVTCLDLVISEDTSIAHLAAALGKPTWILLPYTPDFRWLLDRDDSPWYPSVRLFRQSEGRNYAEVLNRVRRELGAAIAASRR